MNLQSLRRRMIVGACVLVTMASCGKDEPAPEPAKPAPASAPAKTPDQADAPKPEPAGAAPAPPTRAPKPHQRDRKQPPPPDGMVWISGTVNRAPGVFKPDTTVTDVCVHERKDLPCAETDNAGYYEIAVPKEQNVALVFRGPKLTPTLRVFVSPKESLNLGNTRVADTSGLQRIAKAVGTEETPDKGGIFFGGVQGTTATLEPPSGKRFFLAYGNNLEPEAKGVPLRGSGGFVAVTPGKTAIRYSHPEGKCWYHEGNAMGGWPDPADPGVAIVPVLPGHHVHMTTMFCERKESAKPKAGKPQPKPAAKPKAPAATKKP
ncbi:MAG: hypothetical protein OXT09_07105 [Myxococcales bacterium]|nr:hypothetical protein [Myxococcales bacterium]